MALVAAAVLPARPARLAHPVRQDRRGLLARLELLARPEHQVPTVHPVQLALQGLQFGWGFP